MSASFSPVAKKSPFRNKFFRRNSTGSRPSRSAIMSIWLSYAHTAWGTPKPRNAPAGTTLVHTAQESIHTWGILYGPDIADPPLRATTGPISLYAPVLKLALTLRATSTPSFLTPVFMRIVAGCLHTVTNSSSLLSIILTGRFAFSAKNDVMGSNLSDPFDPKPPPRVSTITLTRASGRLNNSAICERMAWGIWVEVQIVSFPWKNWATVTWGSRGTC